MFLIVDLGLECDSGFFFHNNIFEGTLLWDLLPTIALFLHSH